jgi:hypothetical protein
VIIAAEMIAAKLFNEREGNALNTIYGAVTTGTNWNFLKYEGGTVYRHSAHRSFNQLNFMLYKYSLI